MGEVAPQDRELVPGPDEPPSAEFLQQVGTRLHQMRCEQTGAVVGGWGDGQC